MFNCHLDTALSGDPTDAMFAGPLRPEWKSEARRKSGLIFGSGIFNDKGPFASVLIAAHALKKAGVKLAGDILLTGVCSEIGRAPRGPVPGGRPPRQGDRDALHADPRRCGRLRHRRRTLPLRDHDDAGGGHVRQKSCARASQCTRPSSNIPKT